MSDRTKLLDPVCDMIVVVAEAHDQGLTMDLGDREYAFCAQGCLVKFAKSPQSYTAKVDAWLAAGGAHSDDHGHASGHGHGDELPVIDTGMREWYKSCRCCLSDAFPAVVEQLDAEKAAIAQPPSAAGICETAEAGPSIGR